MAEQGDLFARFAATFLAGADKRVVRTRGAAGLAEVARQGFELIQRRAPGERIIRLGDPADRPGHSVAMVLQQDRPFLVDTFRMTLRRHELAEQLLLHPILAVERDAEGRLRSLGGPEAQSESLLYVELFPRLERAEERAAFEAELASVFASVADVTDDYRRMVAAVREVAARIERAGPLLPDGAERAGKIGRFLDWLLTDHFVLMGFRGYEVSERSGEREVRLAPGSGLGMWRQPESSRFREPQRGAEIPGELHRTLDDPRIILIGKARIESRVHRAGRLDRVLLKHYDDAGRVAGFSILAGLFTFRALRTPASQVPLLSERLDAILAEEAATPGSHRYKSLVAAFDSAPVEFLLSSDLESNAALIREMAGAEGSEEARLVLRADRDGRSFYAAVVLPRERYSEELRGAIRGLLERRAGASFVDDRVSFFEEGSAVLHFFCTAQDGAPVPTESEALEAEIETLTAPWEDRFLDALIARAGEAEGPALAARYGPALPEALRVTTHPADAVRDALGLEALHAEGEPRFAFYFEHGAAQPPETTTLRIYLARPWLLSDLLPVVDHFGIRVVDARQTPVSARDRAPAVINTLRVLPLGGVQEDLDALAPRLSEALSAALRGVTPDDELNGLVLGAGLDWREVDLVRAYLEYFNQIQGALTRPFVRSVLLDNPLAVRLLVRYHEARLAPEPAREPRAAAEARLRRSFQTYRDRIGSLNEDRALGALYELIDATLRTNFFQPREGEWRLAFKLDPRRLAGLRPPQPFREIFVHAAGVDGIHLRGGPVARGGLRWSDRLDDFRTEVLGLMRTQMLKNGLIVPVGAKGGFVLRRAGLAPREARAPADAQYRVFVAGLLDVTDNLDRRGPRAAPARRRTAATATTPTWWSPPTRALRTSPMPPTRSPSRAASGSATPSPPAAPRATTTRSSHHRARRLGVRAAPLRRARHRPGARRLHGRRHRRHVGRRLRQRAAARERAASCWPPSTTATCSSTRIPTPRWRTPSASASSRCRRSSWADYDRAKISQGRRRLAARREEHRALPARARAPRRRRRTHVHGPGDRARDPGDAGRPALERRHRHLREGEPARPTPTSATARTTPCASTPASCARASSAEGGNLGFTQAARVEAALRGRAPRHATRSTTRAASTSRTTR